jgi:flagellar hook-length control protein FliK
MNFSIIIPGLFTPEEHSCNNDLTGGESAASGEFTDLLASLMGTLTPAVAGAELPADDSGAPADSAPEIDPVPEETHDDPSDGAAISAFIARPPPRAIDSEPNALSTDRAPEIAAAPRLPQFESPVTAAAVVHGIDDQSERISFADEMGLAHRDDDVEVVAQAPASIGETAADIPVAIDKAELEHAPASPAKAMPAEIPEPKDVPRPSKPAAAAPPAAQLTQAADVTDGVTTIDDVLGVAAKELNAGVSEQGEPNGKAAERHSTDGETFAWERPNVETAVRQARPVPDAQARFVYQRENAPGERAQVKPVEPTTEPLDTASPRAPSVPADVLTAKPIHSDSASENSRAPAWRPVVERVTEQFVRQVRIGEQQAVIELEPPELGKIRIDLRVEGEQIHARIVTEEQGTKALIESRLTELHQALDVRQVEIANLRVDQQSVSTGGGDWGKAFDNGEPRQGGGQARDDSAFADGLPDEAPRENPPRDPGRISMWA